MSPPWLRKPLLLALLLLLLLLGLTAAFQLWRAGQPPVPGDVSAQALSAASPDGAASAGSSSIESMVQALAQRLQQQPNDAAGWAMLGRSYLVMSRHADAAAALQKSLALQPQDAQTHADLADALAFVAGRRFDGEPERLIQRALQLDPSNAKALELAGTLAFDRQDFKQAVLRWQAALAVLNPQSPTALNLRAGIVQAQRRLAGAASDPGQAAASPRISGRITLAPGLKSRVLPDDTVLIFARLVDGPRSPVAVIKRRAAELPLDFVLDERSALNPSLRLSPSMQVVVGARVSRTGQAAPQSGDLQGFAEPVSVGSHGLLIEVGETVK